MPPSRGLGVLHYLGLILMVVGVALFVPLGIAAAFAELDVPLLLSFAIPAAIIFTSGFFAARLIPPREIDVRMAIMLSALIWAFIPLLGAIPYMLIQGMSFIDSYFEGMAGFTTTGLTMITDVESLPRSLQFWRTLTEWLGGVGVILLFLSILVEAGTVSVRLYRAEARTDRISPTIVGTVRRIWWIYVGFTVTWILLLWGAGMPLFEAINHGMTAIATGGFSVKNQSIGAYNDSLLEALVILGMIVGTISFATHYHVFRGKLSKLYRSSEVQFMLLAILSGTLLIAFSMILRDGYAVLDGFRYAIFHVVSAISTTGFKIMDLSTLDPFSRTFLILLMIMGGGYGSTAGAMKLIRVITILKFLIWSVRRFFLPRGAVPALEIDGEPVEDSQLFEALRFMALYVILLFAGTMAMTALGYNLADALFDVTSAQGNVGLSVGVASPSMHPLGKIVFIVEMWAGRLEILPVLLVFVYALRGVKD
ncbi:MAG: TrkH family potassium uptake protein [Candidatus Bathyarchaeia archaeon]